MEVKAKLKSLRVSPKKVRLVAGVIRGVDATEGLVKLNFTNKASAPMIAKLLKSAIANAEETYKLDKSNLFVKEIRVDEGPVMKRWMPRAFGRATPLRKKTSHISLILAEKVPTDEKKLDQLKKKDDKSDLIKLGDMDKKKVADKTIKKDMQKTDDKKGQKTQKGFGGKIFNRKAGEK